MKTIYKLKVLQIKKNYKNSWNINKIEKILKKLLLILNV
jgi:hypothetical protein